MIISASATDAVSITFPIFVNMVKLELSALVFLGFFRVGILLYYIIVSAISKGSKY